MINRDREIIIKRDRGCEREKEIAKERERKRREE